MVDKLSRMISSDAKRTEMPRFRSQWAYGPDCPSETVYGPSLVDSSQHEEVRDLVDKLIRGEIRINEVPAYDDDGQTDPEKVIDAMPVVRTSGFDLADASVALKEGREALRSHAQAVKDSEAQGKKSEPEKSVNAPAAKTDATGPANGPA